MASEIKTNPCRSNIFEVFQLDKSEMDIRKINEAVKETNRRLKFSQLVARDGTDLSLTQAELNHLETRLRDPVKRLEAEQIAHQDHRFMVNEEISGCVKSLAEEEKADDQLTALFAETRTATLQMMSRFLPTFVPPLMDDDLPWPELPEPLVPERETLADAILRD